MRNQYSELAYRSAAAEGATHIGLLTLAYDGLACDLQRAANAVRGENIEARCKACNRALLLLGHLEDWLQYLDDAKLSTTLNQFYAFVRNRILQLQPESRPEDFESLATMVIETRAVWHKKEQLWIDALSNVATSQFSPTNQESPALQRRPIAWSA